MTRPSETGYLNLKPWLDIRTIQLTLGHSDMRTTQRYLNITGEESRRALTGMCNAAGS